MNTSPAIRVGERAAHDPILAYSSVIASGMIAKASALPERRRLAWLRDEFNKVQPGQGNEILSRYRELKRRGKAPNQALFDGLRLTVANAVAHNMEQKAPPGLSGLGSSREDITAVFCGITMVGGVGGGIYLGGTNNPAGSAALNDITGTALTSGGCSAAALAEQARIAEANAAAAIANAQAGSSGGSVTIAAEGNTMMWVGIGGGVLLLGLLGFVALRK